MTRFMFLLYAAAIATACHAPAVETGSSASEETPAATDATSTSEDADDSTAADDPTNTHGLKLSIAREAIADLTRIQTRGRVENLLGEPDRTNFTNPDGTLTETEGSGLLWTYEWTLTSGKRIRFFIGFQAGSAGSRITHSYWLHDA